MTRLTTNAGKALAREHPELAEIVRAVEVEAADGMVTWFDEAVRAAELAATPDSGSSSVAGGTPAASPEGGPLSGAAPEPPFPYYADDDVRMGR